MANNEIQLCRELNEQAVTADLSTEISADATSSGSSLISVANLAADSFSVICHQMIPYSLNSLRSRVGLASVRKLAVNAVIVLVCHVILLASQLVLKRFSPDI